MKLLFLIILFNEKSESKINIDMPRSSCPVTCSSVAPAPCHSPPVHYKPSACPTLCQSPDPAALCTPVPRSLIKPQSIFTAHCLISCHHIIYVASLFWCFNHSCMYVSYSCSRNPASSLYLCLHPLSVIVIKSLCFNLPVWIWILFPVAHTWTFMDGY